MGVCAGEVKLLEELNEIRLKKGYGLNTLHESHGISTQTTRSSLVQHTRALKISTLTKFMKALECDLIMEETDESSAYAKYFKGVYEYYTISDEISDNMKRFIKDLGMTAKEASKIIGIQSTLINTIKTGASTSLDVFVTIAESLKMDIYIRDQDNAIVGDDLASYHCKYRPEFLYNGLTKKLTTFACTDLKPYTSVHMVRNKVAGSSFTEVYDLTLNEQYTLGHILVDRDQNRIDSIEMDNKAVLLFDDKASILDDLFINLHNAYENKTLVIMD